MIRALMDEAEAETRAALDGLTKALDGPELPVDASLVVLRVYGDALRLRLEAPSALRRWAENRSPSFLDDVLGAGLSLVDRADVPPAGTTGAGADPAVRSVVLDRDHAESVLHAVRRAWLPRPMSQLSTHRRLVDRLAEIDRALASVLTRTEVREMLGPRIALGASWTEALRDAEELEVASSLAALPPLTPSPEIVARYIEGGLMQRIVERAADADAGFASELMDAIGAMRAAGQAGFVARRWQQKRASGESAALAWRFSAPPPAHAAASHDEAPLGEVHRLGRLFVDLDADASLFVGGREIALEIDFELGTLATVSFGGETRHLLETDSTCRITVPRSSAPIRLEVTARSGQSVSEALSFTATRP